MSQKYYQAHRVRISGHEATALAHLDQGRKVLGALDAMLENGANLGDGRLTRRLSETPEVWAIGEIVGGHPIVTIHAEPEGEEAEEEECTPYLWVGVRGISFSSSEPANNFGQPGQEPPYVMITVFEPPLAQPSSDPDERPYVLSGYSLWGQDNWDANGDPVPSPNFIPAIPAGGYSSEPQTLIMFPQLDEEIPLNLTGNFMSEWDKVAPGIDAYYQATDLSGGRPWYSSWVIHTPNNMYLLHSGFALDPRWSGSDGDTDRIWEQVAVLDPGDPPKQFDQLLPVRWAAGRVEPGFGLDVNAREWHLRGRVRRGTYVIKVHAQNTNECAEEPVTAELEVRVGRPPGRITTVRRTVQMAAASNWFRDYIPYGHHGGLRLGSSQDGPPEFGPNSHGTNWWQGAVLANVAECSATVKDFYVPDDSGYRLPEFADMPYEVDAVPTPNPNCGCVNILPPPEQHTRAFVPYGAAEDGSFDFSGNITQAHLGFRLATVVSTDAANSVCQVQVLDTCGNDTNTVHEKGVSSGYLITTNLQGGVALGTGNIFYASHFGSNPSHQYSLGDTVVINNINLPGAVGNIGNKVGVIPLGDTAGTYPGEEFANANLVCIGTGAYKDIINDYELKGWQFDFVTIDGRDYHLPVIDPFGNSVDYSEFGGGGT